MAAEVEPSHQYPLRCCCRVTDGSRGAVWQNGIWCGNGSKRVEMNSTMRGGWCLTALITAMVVISTGGTANADDYIEKPFDLLLKWLIYFCASFRFYRQSLALHLTGWDTAWLQILGSFFNNASHSDFSLRILYYSTSLGSYGERALKNIHCSPWAIQRSGLDYYYYYIAGCIFFLIMYSSRSSSFFIKAE